MKNTLWCHRKLKWLIKAFLNVICLFSLSATAGSLSTTPCPTTITSHAALTSVPCTYPMSVGGGAATTASLLRSGSSPTGHGRLTSTSTSQTGAPHHFQSTGRWRGRPLPWPWYPRRRDWCRGEENAWEIHLRRTENEERKDNVGLIALRATGSLTRKEKTWSRWAK